MCLINYFSLFNLAVQHERGPRNSTLRRQQLAFFYNDGRDRMLVPNNGVLDLAMVKAENSPPRLDVSPHLPGSPLMFNSALSHVRVSV